MYIERDSQTCEHKITQDGLTFRKNQLIYS